MKDANIILVSGLIMAFVVIIAVCFDMNRPIEPINLKFEELIGIEIDG